MYWLLRVVVVVLLGLISTPVSSLECEYYSSKECGYSNGGPCESSRRNITCDPDGPSKVHSCYVLWQRPNDSDQQEVLQLKGCFLNDKTCIGQNTCIEKKQGKKHESQGTKALYCCCDKDYCNQEYHWDPAPLTTTTPKRKQQVEIEILRL